MNDDYPDTRCPSSCEIAPGVIKRCTRAIGHPMSERHLWVEALERIDGLPQLVEWSAPDANAPEFVRFLVESADDLTPDDAIRVLRKALDDRGGSKSHD